MGDTYPTIRLAAVQAAPVFLDREATVELACRLILEAGANGADVVGFPEGFVPAHPVWFHFHPATSPAAMDFSKELFANAVVVPGRATDRLAQAARAAGTQVVIGICEKEASSMGSMFNSQLVIGRDGSIIGVRRKLVPTVGERIVHSAGSGDSVRVFDTDVATLGGLMCGENSNPLLTYALGALGAKVHVAAWPSFFNRAADLQAIADIACRAIAYQNSAFVISSIAGVSPEMEARLPATDEDRAHISAAGARGGSAIYAPGGALLAGPLPGGEAIAYADADLGRIVPRKIVHDYAGDYNRFDIFQLIVNTSPAGPPIRLGGLADGAPTGELGSGVWIRVTGPGARPLLDEPASDAGASASDAPDGLEPVEPPTA